MHARSEISAISCREIDDEIARDSLPWCMRLPLAHVGRREALVRALFAFGISQPLTSRRAAATFTTVPTGNVDEKRAQLASAETRFAKDPDDPYAFGEKAQLEKDLLELKRQQASPGALPSPTPPPPSPATADLLIDLGAPATPTASGEAGGAAQREALLEAQESVQRLKAAVSARDAQLQRLPMQPQAQRRAHTHRPVKDLRSDPLEPLRLVRRGMGRNSVLLGTRRRAQLEPRARRRTARKGSTHEHTPRCRAATAKQAGARLIGEREPAGRHARRCPCAEQYHLLLITVPMPLLRLLLCSVPPELQHIAETCAN